MWLLRHPWMTAIGAVILLITCPAAIMITLITSRVGGKTDAWRSPALPAARGGDGEPIPQLESHTCGLLSLSAAYALYGLSPEEKNLRYRLGVDVPASPIDSTSTGTLHPDLLRVLVQDGFDCSMPAVAAGGREALMAHLQGGDAALLLIRRRETGGLHWVLCDAIEGGNLRIVDSLQPKPTVEPLDAYLAECVLSIILIRPAESGAEADIHQAHREGAAEMIRVKQRLDELKAPQR